MSFFEFPYTRTYSSDLGWLIRQLDWVTREVQFKTIKYADPIAWDITTQYEQNTIVMDTNTGIAYLSTQPVPAGVTITNPDYWTPIFDLSQIITNITANLTIHDNGTSPTLLDSVLEGDWIVWNNVLYMALADMIAGTALIPDTNIKEYSVEELTKNYTDTLRDYVDNTIGDLPDLTTSDKTSVVNAINSVLADLSTLIGSLADLTTSDKTSIVNAINSVLSDLSTVIGSLADLTTSDKTSIVNAINSVLSDLSTVVGSLADLTTSDKTSIVNAINSVLSDLSTVIGSLAGLTTVDKTSIVNAINEVVSSLNSEISNRAYEDAILKGFIDAREIKQSFRKYILIFDSYGGLGVSTIAAAACPGGSHVLNVGGAGFVGNGGGQTWVEAFELYVSSISPDDRLQYTDVMIFGGVNDYAYQTSDIIDAMVNFDNVKNTYVPHCKVTLCPVSWATRLDNTISYYVDHTIPAYSLGSSQLNWDYVDGLNAYIHSDIYMQGDGVHPTGTGCQRLGNAIATLIKTGRKPALSTAAAMATFTPVSGTYNGAIETIITDDVVKLVGYIIAVFSSAITIPTSALYSAKIGSLSNTYFQGNVLANGLPANAVTIPAYVHNTVTNAWELHPITLQVYYFGIYACIEGPTITIDAIQTPIFEIESNLNMA